MASNHDDIPSIVPERDELISHRKGQGAAVPLADEVVAVRTSGAVKFFLTMATLGLLACAAAGYHFYVEGEQALAALGNAQNRILQLESRLSMMDESVEQSSLGLLERVDFNFSEIDKLWAARNQNRSDIAELRTTLEEIEQTMTVVEGALSTHGNMLSENTTLVTNIQTRLENMSSNIAGMDDLGQQLGSIVSDLDNVKMAMMTMQNGLASRVDSTEQDIESINVYRLQLNQTIDSIQSRISDLQQRVGTGPAAGAP